HQELHQRVVGGHPGGLIGGSRLDDEHVGPADRLLVAAVHLAVGEGPQVDRPEIDVELAGDLRGQLHRSPPAEHHQALGVVLRDVGEHLGALLDDAFLDRAHVVLSPCFASSPSCAFDSLAVLVYPSMFSCSGREIPRAPGGTSRVITDPAPVYAASPTFTGATNAVSTPIRTWSPITVRCLRNPSQFAVIDPSPMLSYSAALAP